MGEERQGQGQPEKQGGQGDTGIDQTQKQGDESTRKAQPRQGEGNTQTTETDNQPNRTGGTQESNR